VKQKNIPIIMLTNSSIHNTFKNANLLKIETLEARFIQVQTERSQKIDLQFE